MRGQVSSSYVSVTKKPHVHLVTYSFANAAGPIPSSEKQSGPLQADAIVRITCEEHKQPRQSDQRKSTLREQSLAPCETQNASDGQQAAEPGSEDDRVQESADVQRQGTGDQASRSGEGLRQLWSVCQDAVEAAPIFLMITN